MEWLSKIVLDGVIVSIAAAAWLTLIMLVNPRIMLHDYPDDIQRSVPPKTPGENRLTYWLGVPFVVLLFAGPLVSALGLGPGASFWQLWLTASGVAFTFNLFDWLILDWLIFCTITPKVMVIPGSEGQAGYKDYRFHFIGFLKGTVFSVVSGLLVAGVAMIFV